MYVFFEKGIIFKKIIDAIKDLVEQGTFCCSDKGIELKNLDKNHIAYIHLFLKSSKLDEYKASPEQQLLNINISSILAVLKWIKGNECLIWETTENKDKMTFFIGEERTQKFDLNLMDNEYGELEIPEIKYDCKLKMNSDEFSSICKNLNPFSETVEIVADPDEGNDITFNVKGMMGDGSIVLKDGVNDNIIKVKRDIKLRFSLPYLINFSKASTLSNKVTLYFCQDTPAIIEYKIDLGFIKYYLAPKEEE